MDIDQQPSEPRPHSSRVPTLSADATWQLLAALRRIAAIPLWGESIADHNLRAEYLDAGEYDAAADDFNPSCDTESTYLRDAVELARMALLSTDGTG